MTEETPTPGQDSVVKKAKRAAKRNPKKTAATFSLATVVLALQAFGALAPMVCALPFIHDTEKCMILAGRASEAARNLHALDSIQLDSGALMVEDEGEDAP